MQKLQGLKQKDAKGFTIIEVVLVLAIAGLIFLMVFIALPALQRSQADTQRRSDASRFLSAISSYQTNNRGTVPAATAAGYTSFVSTYLASDNDSFADPSGNGQDITVGSTTKTVYKFVTGTPSELGDLYYKNDSTCNTDGTVKSGVGNRKVAVVVKLANGLYCANN